MPMMDLMIELSFCSVRFHWMLVALAVRLAAHPLAHLLRCWLVDYLSFLLFFRSRASVSGNFPVSLIILLVSPSLLFSVSGCSMYKYFLRVRPVESTLYMTKYFVHDKVLCTRHHVRPFSSNTTSSHFSCAFFHSHFAMPSFLLNHYNLTNLK